MFKNLLEKLFKPDADRIAIKLKPLINSINELEPKLKKMTNDELFSQTTFLKAELARGESLKDILPHAFATVREVSQRVLNMRHFDVQLIGGYVLHSGKISEMKTGEGKTLVATLALYLNALEEKGAHLVTVNDYLARRDAMWMSPIYLSLGLSVGIIQHEVSYKIVWDDITKFSVKIEPITRKEAYASDITYGTNNEFGFDYLRDNMKYDADDYVQRDLHYAIVDEVDSILIDEARTPLIISGPTDQTTDKYYNINNVVKLLQQEIHYTIDEKRRASTLTDEGINFVESKLNVGNLFEVINVDNLHYVNNAVKAHAVFKVDVDYVVQEDQIIIVDEFTGRLMKGRRYSDGLHQALEAKENVTIQNENQTYASITFQNYFRMYKKLSGMTGTALTEANEFRQIYGLEVVPIPTHRKMVRIDNPDTIFRTTKEKYDAIANEISRLKEKGQPVLVGTVSIEQSELISNVLTKKGIKHEVLNAKNHEREAQIIQNAGQTSSVTIATNMAGRGTDIKLGEKVESLGGLFILGTERHESRRIDNQLRGRSGRQGDSGESRFYLSMQDDLLRIFGAEKISSVMDKLGMEEGEPIEHSLISRAIENAQKKVEAMHFEVRKHLLEYDNVSNQQRKVVYELRRDILNGTDNEKIILEYASETISNLLEDFITETPDTNGAEQVLARIFDINADLTQANVKHISDTHKYLMGLFSEKLKQRQEQFQGHFNEFSKYILINILDTRWKEHLLQMDHLRDSVGLRGYGQKDPLVEYKREAYGLFVSLLERIKKEVVDLLMHVRVKEQSSEEIAKAQEENMRRLKSSNTKRLQERRVENSEARQEKKAQPIKRHEEKVGRNDACPCGSGKKYKNCHGA